MRWTIALAALGISILGLGAFSLASAGSAHAATTEVEAGNYYFCDSAHQGQVCETDVNAGDTITWSVATGTHRVVQCADATYTGCPSTGGFDGGNFSTGATFSQTFATAGTYFYECHIHQDEMRGKIVVTALATASPSPTAAASATAVPTATAAAVPKTGGAPAVSGTDLWQYALLAAGMTLLGGSGFAFAVARKR
jgi:plastocyanin